MGPCLAVLLVVGSAILWPAQPLMPDVPKEIAAPAGCQLLFIRSARGMQIYKAAAGGSGQLEWVLDAPLADLLDISGEKVGWHYEGPAWEALDGSKVVRDKTAEVKSTPAPKPKEDIPWLLVKVKPEAGPNGQFSPMVYIQRIQTTGGKPPTDLPKRAGTRVGVPYKAVYCFYGKTK